MTDRTEPTASGARVTDADSVDPLMAAMAAAWRHDTQGVVAALDEAETFLGSGFHQSRDSITRARTAAQAGEWVAAWSLARQATCTLTWAFPPAVSVCPPMPNPDLAGGSPGTVCRSCSGALPERASFCIHCGEKVAS